MSEISVSYVALEHATTQIKQISGQVNTELQTLRQGLQKIQWEGADRESYNAAQKKWDDAIKDLNDILHQIGGAVDVAKQNYQSTEKGNAGLWG